MAQHRCSSCGEQLTREERRFYAGTCDRCEREETEQIEDWRHGRADEPELDRIFGEPDDERSLN